MSRKDDETGDGEEFIVENKWRCTSCGAENRGRDMKCLKCGNPKGTDEDYVVPDPETAEKVTDGKMLEQAEAGPNWVCAYCGFEQRSLSNKCKSCGAEQSKPEAVKPPPAPKPPKRRTGLIVAGIVLVIGAVVFALLPREKVLTVKAVSWTSSATLSVRVVKHGEGWRDGAPATMFNAACETRQDGFANCNPYQCNPHDVAYRCNPHNCNPHQVSRQCNPHNCNPHQVSRQCNPHNCNPHQVSKQCRPHDCNCSTSCTNLKNGYSKCRKTCSTCYDTCSRTEYSTCYDTCSRTEYSTCYDTCHDTVYDTCHDTCHRTEYDTCHHRCPVMRQWCKYDYRVWETRDTRTERGTTVEVKPPEIPVEISEDAKVERQESYGVIFTDGKKDYPYVPADLASFVRFVPGTRWVVTSGVTGIEPVRRH